MDVTFHDKESWSLQNVESRRHHKSTLLKINTLELAARQWVRAMFGELQLNDLAVELILEITRNVTRYLIEQFLAGLQIYLKRVQQKLFAFHFTNS